MYHLDVVHVNDTLVIMVILIRTNYSKHEQLHAHNEYVNDPWKYYRNVDFETL